MEKIMQGKETEDLNGSMEKLNIEESSSSFKKKPVIIIVVGMAGNFMKFHWVCGCICGSVFVKVYV